MTDNMKCTNTAFSQQQRTEISNACERVQNAININNSIFAEINENLVRKADEIAIKWKAYGLPYNAIRDAVLEMAMWQKEQMMNNCLYNTEVMLRTKQNNTEYLTLANDKLPHIPVSCGLNVGDKVKVIIIKEESK